LKAHNTQESSKFSLSTGSIFPKEKVLVDGAGFEPAASTMPTWLQLDSDCLEKFADFLLVNMRLEKKTVQQNIQDARRFLEMSNYVLLNKFELDQKESGIAEETGRTPMQSLKQVVRLIEFNEPSQVKQWLANLIEHKQ